MHIYSSTKRKLIKILKGISSMAIAKQLTRELYANHTRCMDEIRSPDGRRISEYDFIRFFAYAIETKMIRRFSVDKNGAEKLTNFNLPDARTLKEYFAGILIFLTQYQSTPGTIRLKENMMLRFTPSGDIEFVELGDSTPGVSWGHSVEEIKEALSKIERNDPLSTIAFDKLQHSLIGDADPGAKLLDMEFHGAAAAGCAVGGVLRQILMVIDSTPGKGKTTYSRIINRIALGTDYNRLQTSVCLSRIGDAKTAQEIPKGMLNTSPDIPHNKSIDGQLIKPYATGDWQQARGAYSKTVDKFRNQAALKVIGNFPPPISGADAATYSRFMVIDCAGDGPTEKKTYDELWIDIETEQLGVRAKMCVALADTLKRKGYTETKATDEHLGVSMRSGDLVRYFLEEECEFVEEINSTSSKTDFTNHGCLTFSELYDCYSRYEGQNGTGRKTPRNNFAQKLTHNGVVSKRLGKGKTTFTNVTLNARASDDKDNMRGYFRFL